MNSEITNDPVLIPTQPNLFFSKNDANDIRLGDLIKSLSLESALAKGSGLALLGYPDDEGIRLNGGRLGAAEAPKLIRQFLYKMTPTPFKALSFSVFDLGDLRFQPELATRHEHALAIITKLHQKKIRTMSFGGGHDYGYSDTAGFVRGYLPAKIKPMVINFDAHLDVRPTSHGYNSGTPFYRLLSEFKNEIDFVEIGLQPQCNSEVHWQWALDNNAILFDLKSVEANGLKAILQAPVFKKLTKETPVFISFDIDALAASEAGGCSQAWMTGLKVSEVLNFLGELYQKANTCGLGIYEVSPPLDRDFQTSKTAALIAHHFLFENLQP